MDNEGHLFAKISFLDNILIAKLQVCRDSLFNFVPCEFFLVIFALCPFFHVFVMFI